MYAKSPVCINTLSGGAALLLAAVLPLVTASAATPRALKVEAVNPLPLARPSETIEVPWADVARELSDPAPAGVHVFDDASGRELVAQTLDTHGDATPEWLLFQADFAANQTRTFTLRVSRTPRDPNTPSPVHAKFVPTRMDDFAWESDRIAYRMYGPALRVETISNGIDVWCKSVRYPILEKWYQPGVDYHHDHGEGADFFKVGDTLGCGGTALWQDGKLRRGENFASWRILGNGPVRTVFELRYDPIDVGGRKISEVKRLSLDAGHNLTKIEMTYQCEPPTETLEFVAGLLLRPEVKASHGEKRPWIALWGPIEEVPNSGDLGTGVVMSAAAFKKVAEADNHLLALGTAKVGQPVVYWAGAGWTKSGDFSSAADWDRYLDEWAQRVAAPLRVTVRTPSQAGAASDARMVPIAKGWARNAINAAIFRQHAVTTHDDTQYVAFYDGDGKMVLGKRKLGTTEWELHTTPYKANVNDAHNSISIGVDGAGVLHVAWDNHNNPLHYARAKTAGSLELGDPTPMTGQDEGQATYPEFYNLANGDLVFMYRSGGSGRGNTMLNRYDVKTGKWAVVQHPLIDGQGQRNAYLNQLAIDADGGWHTSWCWRETGDVATNHDLCYAHSTDEGRTWMRSDGSAYELPITAVTAEVVCPVPQKHELINQCTTAVDTHGHPLIATYWRPEGATVPQYHVVWYDGTTWQTAQVGTRKTPFSLSGGGTKRIPISRPKLAVDAKGCIYMLFRDAERGDRVSVAISDDAAHKDWRIVDLTDASVGQWEPAYDPQVWQTRGELHVFVQRVGQGDGETLENVPPQVISILEWQPQ